MPLTLSPSLSSPDVAAIITVRLPKEAQVTPMQIRLLLFVATIIISCPGGFSQTLSPPPYTPSLDLTSIDKTVDPCEDLYRYACGGWQKNNPIPADATHWDVTRKMYEQNLEFLRGILEEAASEKKRDTVTQEIGNFYAACMNEAAINSAGMSALQPELNAIREVRNRKEFAPLVARLQLESPGNSIMFGFGSRTDYDDSTRKIAEISQGGIGLPDRDYYTKDDPGSKEVREHYLEHVQKVFALMGEPPELAKTNAAVVMRIETALAQASLTRVERRDPYTSKNKMTVGDLAKLAPHLEWPAYFRALDAPQFETLNVGAPAFFKELNMLLATESIDNWKAYLRFHLENSFAPYLSSQFAGENFDFYSKYLHGAKELQPRWKRCVEYTDMNLGEALGQAYVRKVFPSKLKASTLDMVRRIEAAMDQRIRGLDWMSQETKDQALVKLHGIHNKIGYPDRWLDYSAIEIAPNDFFTDIHNSTVFEGHRDINKIGKPVDAEEWNMTPPTVDAGYAPQQNEIVFPAGVLQPPFYDAKMDDAPNYGDTGSDIGHELTHGFDDLGRQFDANGNLRDWWSKEDAAKFKERTQCIEDQYSHYVVVDDVHVNGKLTLGENIADLGGSILAYTAWKEVVKDKQLGSTDGFTPEQRFFIGFAQWACSNERAEDLRVRAVSDPHAPAQYRVNGVVVNMPEFEEAFQCTPNSPMAPVKRCRVW
jgi:putative endopeptidase